MAAASATTSLMASEELGICRKSWTSSSAPTASSPGTAASRSAPVRRGVTPPSAAAKLSASRDWPGAEVLAIVPPSVNSATLMITIVSAGGAPPPVEGNERRGVHWFWRCSGPRA